MIHTRHSLIGLCVAAACVGVLAQGTDEHKDHHPANAAAPVAPAAPRLDAARPLPGQSMGADDMTAMDRHLQTMQSMHEKMAAAKTPQERQAFMAEHMKAMQEGMRMMESMRGKMASGKAPAGMPGMQPDMQMMEKRMAMMEAMMQMMMDRMSMPQTSTPSTR